MGMMRTLTLIPVVYLAGLCACGGRPEIPVVSPRATQITGVAGNGLSMQIDLLIHNPNSYDLTVYALRADVSAQGRNLGVVESATQLNLTGGQWTAYTTQVVVPWGDLPSLAATALFQSSVPYHVEGRVMVRGPAGYTARVPFVMDGQIPRGMLIRIPGL